MSKKVLHVHKYEIRCDTCGGSDADYLVVYSDRDRTPSQFSHDKWYEVTKRVCGKCVGGAVASMLKAEGVEGI